MDLGFESLNSFNFYLIEFCISISIRQITPRAVLTGPDCKLMHEYVVRNKNLNLSTSGGYQDNILHIKTLAKLQGSHYVLLTELAQAVSVQAVDWQRR